MKLDLTEFEVNLLINTLTTLSITRQYSTFDPYKDEYGKLLGKLLVQKDRLQEVNG